MLRKLPPNLVSVEAGGLIIHSLPSALISELLSRNVRTCGIGHLNFARSEESPAVITGSLIPMIGLDAA